MCKNWQRKKPAASLSSWKLSMPCIVACPACGALSPTRNWLRLQVVSTIARSFWSAHGFLVLNFNVPQDGTPSHTIPQLPSRYQRSHAWWALVSDSAARCVYPWGSLLFRLLLRKIPGILSTQEKQSHDLRLWRSKFEWVLFNVIQLSPCFFPTWHISHHCPHSHNKGNRSAPLLWVVIWCYMFDHNPR